MFLTAAKININTHRQKTIKSKKIQQTLSFGAIHKLRKQDFAIF